MKETKIQLSGPEMELMCDAGIIFTKNSVLQKVKALFYDLQSELTACRVESDELRRNVFSLSPKISRGENYQGLPYMVLDYPRKFTPENIFAIRTLFWWGNF